MENTPAEQIPSPDHNPFSNTNFNEYLNLIIFGIVISVVLIFGGVLLYKNISTPKSLTSEKIINPTILPINSPIPIESSTPTPTIAPSPTMALTPTITPTLTQILIPTETSTPTPSVTSTSSTSSKSLIKGPPNPPGTCGHDQCCLYSMCGDTLSTSEGGIGFYCTVHQKCLYNTGTGKWGCANDCSCPNGCD